VIQQSPIDVRRGLYKVCTLGDIQNLQRCTVKKLYC